MTFFSRRFVPAIASAAALMVGFGATPAAAHDGGAEIEVDAAHEIPGGIHYVIEVIYEDDGHPAEDATVTATAVGPDGETGDQVEMQPYRPEAGLYDGTVEMNTPGEWTVRFASLDPEGSLSHSHVVEEPAAESEAQDSPEDEAVAEPDVAQTNEDAELVIEEATEDDDGPSVLLLALVFVVLGAVVALVFWLVAKRKNDSSRSGDSSGTGYIGGATTERAGEKSDEDPATIDADGGSDVGGGSGGDGGGGDGGGGGE